MKLKRIEPGYYAVQLANGDEFELVNMQGQAVRYTGVGAHWHVRRAHSSKVLHEAYAKRDAVEWMRTNL